MELKTILVVEDDKTIRENIVEILESKNFKVLASENGNEGYKIALEHQIDLIISDIEMPVMNGFEFLNQVRFHKEICNTPFLFLTSKSMQSDLRKGMNLGADDYLFKPFTINELLTSIEVRLQKHKKIEAEINEKILKIVKQLNNTASHEYNTPLNGILGYSNIILSNFDALPSSRIKEFVGNIKKSGDRLKKTVDKTLLYRSYLNMTEENILKLINNDSTVVMNQNLISNFCYEIADNAIRIKDLYFNIENAVIFAEPHKLNIIIEELTENALNFSNKNTQINIIGRSIDDCYQLSFFNKGRGFTTEQITKIGPFVQFDRDEFEQQGSGLGLYNVMTLCKYHNIGFKIESKQNEFAKIIISFKQQSRLDLKTLLE